MVKVQKLNPLTFPGRGHEWLPSTRMKYKNNKVYRYRVVTYKKGKNFGGKSLPYSMDVSYHKRLRSARKEAKRRFDKSDAVWIKTNTRYDTPPEPHKCGGIEQGKRKVKEKWQNGYIVSIIKKEAIE